MEVWPFLGCGLFTIQYCRLICETNHKRLPDHDMKLDPSDYKCTELPHQHIKSDDRLVLGEAIL